MRPKKVLLAEDDADDREFFLDFIKTRQDVETISIAENGEEVFDSLLKMTQPGDLPDFIILDQNMPKKNGLQTLQMLKEDKTFEHIPVVIYSTYADETLRRQSTSAGAALVFSKPYTAEGYHKMIDDILRLIGQLQ